MAIRKPTCPTTAKAFFDAADFVAKNRREAIGEDQLRDALEGAERGLRAAAFALDVLRMRMRRGGRKAAVALATEREIADEVTRDVSLAAYEDGVAAGRRETDESPLFGKWDDGYVQLLGILEHLEECQALHRAQAIAKAEGNGTAVTRLGGQLEYELCDLFLILQKRFEDDRELVKGRAAKFRP